MLDAARDRAVGAGYAAGWGLVRTLPSPLAKRAFDAAGVVAARRGGPGVAQLRANLRRVVGPTTGAAALENLVTAGMRSYARYWRETFTLSGMDHGAVADSFEANLSGKEHIDAGLAAGNGVILALSHSGNWDASGIWLVAHSGPFTTVAERLKPASVYDRFVAYRESIGMEVLSLTGGEQAPAGVLAQRLRANRVVCLLADRDLSAQGREVDFFGAPARMPSGPALLAARTGATLHTVHSFFVGDDGWGHTISPPLGLPGERLRDRVRAGTQAMADGFAAGIASRPEDWHMLARLWSDDLPDSVPAPTG